MPPPSFSRTFGTSSGLPMLPLQLVEKLLALLDLLLLLEHAGLDVRVRVHGDRAGGAVHDDLPAGVFRLKLVAHADDGGDAHGPGQDGRVARSAAALGDEAQDLALVELDRLAGGEIVRRQNDGHRRVDAALGDAGKDGEDAARHVLHVRGTGLHVGVVHGGEHLGELCGGVGDGCLRVQIPLDEALDGLLEVQVLCHHLMGLKEHGSLVAGLLAGLLGQHAQLLDRLGLGLLETRELRFPVLHLIAAQRALGSLIEIQRPRGDAGGNALSEASKADRGRDDEARHPAGLQRFRQARAFGHPSSLPR